MVIMNVSTATFLRRQLRFARQCAVRAGETATVEEIDWWRARIDELEGQVPAQTADLALIAAEETPAYTDEQQPQG
jgi:hypothetical protein